MLRFALAFVFALAWAAFSIWVSQPWLSDLGNLSHPLVALFVLTFIAYLPGFMNAFLLFSLILQPAPKRRKPPAYPPISLIIAAFNEEQAIGDTLRSLAELDYSGEIDVLLADDGSMDGTAAAAHECNRLFAAIPGRSLQVLGHAVNRGKARALNSALRVARHELVVTIDADTRLERGALAAIVEHLSAAPPGTVAVAGTVLVANPHESWIAGAQEWDYFHGIAAVKRMQSMYNGTLVAQGAFSIYRRQALVDVGGWPDTVGEDIVLTWHLLEQGYRVGHAEDAIAWTRAPVTLRTLAHQRKRWARGMVEALAHHKSLLFRRRLTTMFIWWNLLFVTLDATFTLVFLPGLVLAAFGVFWLAGPITLLVLPLAVLWNLVIYRIQTRMLKREGIEMERSRRGFLLYVLIYPLFMQPVSLWGYLAEFAGRRKEWGKA
jgi:biofilm PGA synthesis N-glycosyltransferase PgaC